jgi:hypothetical protein
VVLIHGYTDNARDWVPLLPYLSKGLRLIGCARGEEGQRIPRRLGTTGVGVEPDVGFVGLPPVGLEI